MDELLRKELSDLNAKFAGLEEKVNVLSQSATEQRRLVDTVHKLALSMERMSQEQCRLRSDVDEIRSAAKKRWDTIITEVIRLLIAAGLGAVLMRLGLS